MLTLSVYPISPISYTHDPSAVLLSDDRVLFAYEEEKIVRSQHALGMLPKNAAVQALQTCGVEPGQIGRLVVTSRNFCGQSPHRLKEKVQFLREVLLFGQQVEVECVPHHLAHSALAVLTSPFERCVFLTMDAGGDNAMGHWGVFADGKFDVRETLKLSPAAIHGYLTSLAGFTLREEGKMMGLSAYGLVNERLDTWLRKNFWIRPGSAVLEISSEVRLRWVSELRLAAFDADAPRQHKYMRKTARFEDAATARWLELIAPADIAATGQRFFEDLVLQAARNIMEQTGLTDLAVSGGAFQNVVLNGRLRALGGIRTHVPLAPHDSGLAVGAGLLSLHQRTGGRVGPLSPYLGPSFSASAIEAMIRNFDFDYETPPDLNAAVVSELVAGRVVGWFQGRAEFGARALGARSVLADPRSQTAKARVNQALKQRDWFMPYAPSILEERGAEFFENFAPSPYMNTAFRVRPEKAALLPSGVHVDGTCRAHTVSRGDHPRYHDLIEQFGHATGVPLILNTSFNRHGVPIVATPRQALQHLAEGNIDRLAIGDFLVRGRPRKRFSPEVYADSFHLALDTLHFAAGLIRRSEADAAGALVRRLNAQIVVSSAGIACGNRLLWSLGEDQVRLTERWTELAGVTAKVV